MARTLEDLIPADQNIRTVLSHESVDKALDIMYQHGYSQLPVVAANEKFQGQVITFDSVLRAIHSFRTEADALLVRDASQRARWYAPDADLLTTLDDIYRHNFALIVDSSRIRIVTTADMAVFFREYAEDLMLIEGIESRVKDAIRACYTGDDSGLGVAIAAVTDRTSDIRRKLPGAIKAYLGRTNIALPPPGTDTDGLAEAEKKLGLRDQGKEFEELTFDEFTRVLLGHPRSPRLSQSKDVSELQILLQQVRLARNKLAHFRGELTAAERRTVQFAAEWLENNLPTPLAKPTLQPSLVAAPAHLHQEEGEGEVPRGSYAPLASYLESLPVDSDSVDLTFQQIEGILKTELPRSASEYRAWWSNDPMKPQSAAWLDEGWRTTSVSMTEGRLTFVRTTDREDAYISFFAKLNARLAKVAGFPLRNVSPQGQSWFILASLDRSRPELATIAASFARGRRLRIELYLDGGDKEENKQLFERLLERRSLSEQVVGEPLKWERMDNRRACRVAVYNEAHILTDAESPTLLEWAAQKAHRFYEAFMPEFLPSRTTSS